MPSAIRNRLKKRQASADLVNAAASDPVESCASSAKSSHESVRPLLTSASTSFVPTEEDGVVVPSPRPPLPQSAETDTDREISPPLTVLERYLKRSAYTTAVHSQSDVSGGSQNEFTSNSNHAIEQRASKSIGLETTPGGLVSPTDTCTFSGVQFDMMPQRRAGAPPRPSGPETDFEPRRTRSQTRMQRRVDSLGSTIDVKDFAVSKDKRSSSTPPCRATNVRSPSPDELVRASHPDPKQLSTTNLSLMPAPLRINTIRPVVQSPNSTSSSRRSPPDPLLSSIPKTLTHGRKASSSNKIQESTTANREQEVTPSPIPVHPPNHLLNSSPLHLWTSDLSFNSRPHVAWEPSKRWTCCQCAQRDPTRLAALTIVEQRVCSRLECRHERCPGGCRIVPYKGFVGLQ